MYGLHGKMVAHPGQRDALVELLLGGARAMPDVDGCYLYIISIVPGDGDGIWVTEVWRDAEAHRASLGLAWVQALIAQARPLIAALPEHMELTPLGGFGLPKE